MMLYYVQDFHQLGGIFDHSILDGSLVQWEPPILGRVFFHRFHHADRFNAHHEGLTTAKGTGVLMVGNVIQNVLSLNHLGKTNFLAVHFHFVDFVAEKNVKVGTVVGKHDC